MDVSGEQRFLAPRALVWEMLLDPGVLKAAFPGCERFEQVAPDAFRLTVAIGLADLKGVYNGTVTVHDRVELESYRLRLRAEGKTGTMTGEAFLRLRDDGPGTIVNYTGDVAIQGAIGRLGLRLLGGSAKLLVGQFFRSMQKQINDRVA